MKVLMLKDYYYPEKCAGISLYLELVEAFANNDINVEIYTPSPCRGIDSSIRNEYKKKVLEIQYDGKVKIHRYSLFKEGNRTLYRAIRYIIQNFIQIIKGLKSDADVLMLSSTPPTVGLVGVILFRLKKIKFIYNVQDVFPDSLLTANITKENSILWKLGNWIANTTYKYSEKIIVITEDIKENLILKGVPKEKIIVIPNWIDVDAISPIKKESNPLFKKLDIDEDKFNIVYAGNLGNAQNIEIIMKAAERIKDEKNIQFIIFGGGNNFNKYKKIIEMNPMSNVTIFALRPIEESAQVYSLADISIVSCKKGVGLNAMPSKALNILSAGTPIVANFECDSALGKLIKENEVGLISEPDDVEMFCQNIIDLYKNKSLMAKYSLNARNYAVENISKEKCTKMYVENIKNM